METLTFPKTCQSASALWSILIIFEFFLAISILIYSYYAIVLFFFFLLVIAIFSLPELAYFLFLFNIVNHLFQLQINYAFSDPPRLWRMEGIPVDIVLVPGLIVDFLILLAGLSWFMSRLAKVRPPYPKTALDLPMLVFFLWLLLSLLWATDWAPALIQIIIMICSYLAFYLSVAVLRTKKLFHAAIWTLIAAGVVNAAIAIYSLRGEALFEMLHIQENLRVYFTMMTAARQRGSGLTYTLFTADFLNIVIMLGIGLAIVIKEIKIKIFLALLLLGITYGSITTLSKAGLFSLGGGLLFFILSYKSARKRWFIIMPAGFIIIAALLQTLPLNYPWPERAELFRERLSFFARSLIWENGLEDLIASYGMGYGVGSFYFSHNLCLDVLFNFGIIGLAIWLWLLYRLYYCLKSSIIKNPVDRDYKVMLIAVSAGFVSLFIFGLSNGFYFEEKNWALFGISMALVNLIQTDEAKAAAARLGNAGQETNSE
jgi:hypothetical protein